LSDQVSKGKQALTPLQKNSEFDNKKIPRETFVFVVPAATSLFASE
jgi:hypothetical protein